MNDPMRQLPWQCFLSPWPIKADSVSDGWSTDGWTSAGNLKFGLVSAGDGDFAGFDLLKYAATAELPAALKSGPVIRCGYRGLFQSVFVTYPQLAHQPLAGAA
jgi:hypothetical protein